MGFFDSFKKSYDEKSKIAQERRRNSNYQTVVQSDAETFRNYNSKSDGELIRLSSAIYLSDEKKDVIEKILRKRGYNKDNRGWFKGRERL